MNDEQILLDDLNAFEDFMENADVEEIKKEHGLSTAHIKPKFQKCSSSFFSISISNIKNDVITLHNRESFIDVALFSCNDGYYCFVQSDFIHGISFSNKNNNIYGLLLKEVNSWIISDFPLYSVNGVQSYLDLYYKHNPVIKSNVNLEVVQGEIVESAEQVHNRICNNFDKVEKTLYDICVDLKSIRDNKHYKTLGYNTFEDYCLENFNMSRFNAYKYISIAENLPDNFVATSQQKQIGLNKLYVLSRLTDEERSELIQTTDIENTPVKEVEKKAKEIKDSKKNDDDSFSDVPVSTSKENQFISMYGKKMNALLKYMKETYKWLFGVNGVSYKSFLGTEKDMPCYDYGTDNIELILKVLPMFCQALKDTANGLIEKDSKADYIKSILVDGVEFDEEVEDNA